MTRRVLPLLVGGVAMLALPLWIGGRRAGAEPAAGGALLPASTSDSPAVGGAALVAELGCGACHAGVPAPAGIAERVPALDYAGLRYRPAYLFAYLQDPRRVRGHIGAARMPDFHLDERESLALTLYLATLRSEADRPRLPGRRLPLPGRAAYPADMETLLRERWGCTGCHSLQGAGGTGAPDLALSGARLDRSWVERYLVAPRRWDAATPMPALFFTESADGLRERMPDAARRVRQVAAYLDALGAPARAAQERAYRDARARHPEVDASLGEALFASLDCAACHTRSPGVGRRDAPDLAMEGARVRPGWLREYLARPTPIRPFGHHPGSGSRMPDFRLSPAEVDSIHAYLTRRGRVDGQDPGPVRALSAFEAAKAETLLRERLPCLGCHALDGAGGRIGPELGAAGARLNPGWIRALIRDPQRTLPGTVMPRTSMPEETRELLTAYLAGRDSTPARPAYLSAADHPLLRPRGGTEDGRRYARYCAACHGPDGGGDGYNAAFLPTRPTRHADAGYLAGRPDDVLFDGIHAGGRVLDRSPRMPGFGETLGAAEIRGLVDHLRALCDCEGPAWSRDGARGGGR